MGREAEARVAWKGQAGRVRAVLEPAEIILRGEVRGRLPRAGLAGWHVEGGDLILPTGEGPLTLTLGAREAAAWAAALARPPPSLSEKLGISAARPAWVTGPRDDPALEQALAGAEAARPGEAAFLVAVIPDRGALDAAVALAGVHPGLPLWCIHPRGRAAAMSDAVIRAELRAAGRVDTKSCAVSDRLTATLYRTRRS